MATISSAGVGSGLDINGIVSQLLDADFKRTEEQLDTDETDDLSKSVAFDGIKASLTSLQNALSQLTSPTVFTSKLVETPDMLGTAAQPVYFTATATASAVNGKHTIQVSEVAQANRHTSKTDTLPLTSLDYEFGYGTLSFQIGSGGSAKTVSVTIDQNHKTLAGIRNAVNSVSASTGVSADVIQVSTGSYRLSFSSTTTGTDYAITNISAVPDAGSSPNLGLLNIANFDQTQEAKNASLKVDGIDIIRSSNTISDVISGLTLNLKQKETVPTDHALNITIDPKGIADKVKAFVEAYNKFSDTYTDATRYAPNTKEGNGILYQDSSIKDLKYRIDNALSTYIGSNPSGYNGLAQVGISFYSESSSTKSSSSPILTGKLKFDETTFNASLTSNATALTTLFSGTLQASGLYSGGVATGLNDTLKEYLAFGGGFDYSKFLINDDLKRISNERIELQQKISEKKEELTRQFAALDALLGTSKAKSAQLKGALDGLVGSGKS